MHVCEWALNATYELFFELDATEEQIEFPVDLCRCP